MRCAILKPASEWRTGERRLLSLATQAMTDRRESDQPPPTASMTKGLTRNAHLSTLTRSVQESPFAGFNRGEDGRKSSRIRNSGTKAQSAGDGEIQGLLTITGAPRDPDVSRATTRRRGIREVRTGNRSKTSLMVRSCAGSHGRHHTRKQVRGHPTVL